MGDPNFPRLMLPFQAQGVPSGRFLTFDEATELLGDQAVRTRARGSSCLQTGSVPRRQG